MRISFVFLHEHTLSLTLRSTLVFLNEISCFRQDQQAAEGEHVLNNVHFRSFAFVVFPNFKVRSNRAQLIQ